MGSYLIIVAILSIVLFAIRDLLIKRFFIKIASKVSEGLVNDNQSLKKANPNFKNVSLYLLDYQTQTFINADGNQPNLTISDLLYRNQSRFKELITDSTANNSCKKEFFRHDSKRHLLFPFKDSDHSIQLLIVEKKYDSLEDIINKG